MAFVEQLNIEPVKVFSTDVVHLVQTLNSYKCQAEDRAYKYAGMIYWTGGWTKSFTNQVKVDLTFPANTKMCISLDEDRQHYPYNFTLYTTNRFTECVNNLPSGREFKWAGCDSGNTNDLTIISNGGTPMGGWSQQSVFNITGGGVGYIGSILYGGCIETLKLNIPVFRLSSDAVKYIHGEETSEEPINAKRSSARDESELLITLQKRYIISIKLDIYQDTTYVNTIQGGVISGSNTIDANSAVRRTASLSFIPDKKSRLVIEEEGYLWIDKNVKMYIGLYNIRNDDITWYKQGTYVFSSASMTYDDSNNTLDMSCSDFVTLLDGTKNGELGQETIKIPAYEEDETTGEVIHYNSIREALIYTVTQLGRLKEYKIDDIGEYLGMPQYNANYLEYREQSKAPVKSGQYEEMWNAVPYDLEFEKSTNVLAIVQELVDLYPNYEFYMDVDNVFCCNMIPSGDEDDAILDDSYMQKILISENATVDMTQVRNVVEVWGSTIDVDYYTQEGVTLSNNTYTASIEGYEEKYCNGDKVGLKIPITNPANAKININNFGAIDIYDENTDQPIAAGLLDANETYVFKIKHKYINKQSIMRAYVLGRYQAHGICALVDNADGNDWYTTTGGKRVRRYSKEFFQEVYACEYVELYVVPDSPFTCQKLGVLLSVKTGGEFDNIESSSLAVSNAEYQLWQMARLSDSITITTKLCPFIDVNKKIKYRPKIYDNDTVHDYITKNISHDYSAGTTTWQIMRWYKLYRDGTVPNS